MGSHVLLTGPITGQIPTPDPRIQGDTLDVTPAVLTFDTQEEAVAAAEAIEDEYVARGTHPAQIAARQADILGAPDAAKLKREASSMEKRVKARAAERG